MQMVALKLPGYQLLYDESWQLWAHLLIKWQICWNLLSVAQCKLFDQGLHKLDWCTCSCVAHLLAWACAGQSMKRTAGVT